MPRIRFGKKDESVDPSEVAGEETEKVTAEEICNADEKSHRCGGTSCWKIALMVGGAVLGLWLIWKFIRRSD